MKTPLAPSVSRGLRLDADTYQAVEQRAEREGITVQTLYRRAVQAYLAQAGDTASPPPPTVPAAAPTGGPHYIRLALSDQDLAQLEAWRTEDDDSGGRNVFVLRWLRSVLQRKPYLSEREILALRERNYQLLGLGRELKQIAKGIAQAEGQLNGDMVRSLSELKRALDADRLETGLLIRYSVNRYAPSSNQDEEDLILGFKTNWLKRP